VEAQDIVIVGAGSAGLATAALLRQLASIRSCLRRAPSMALPGGAGMGRLAPPVGADRGGAAIPLHDSNPAVYIADVVEQAADGQVAVPLVRDLRPDLVVMDITVPRMDGISAARAILDVHPSARFVFLSGTETAKKLSEASEDAS